MKEVNNWNSIRRTIGFYLHMRGWNLDFLKWHYTEARRLIKFENIHQKQDCFIIGNGPSLNKMDLSFLSDYCTFGLNKIYLIFDKVDLNLSYYIAVNPLVIEQSKKEIEHLNCPSFLSYLASKNIIKNKKNIYRILTTAFDPGFYSNITFPINEGYTVTYVALQIAYFMGFKRVFLIGVDHDFKTQGNPNEQQTLQGEDINHFDPRYFSGQNWHLPDLEASELHYRIADFFYERSGRKIYDATVDGKCEIFSKITYTDALKMCIKDTDRHY